jgi:DNA-binding IclR family transcriptional regulator
VPAETSQTLDRGLRVLRVLAASPEGLTVTELSHRLEVNRTVVYRLISTLEQHGLVRRDSRSRLFVGLGVLHLASGVQPLLRDLALPVLRRLAESLGSTAHLARRRSRWRSSSRRGPTSTSPTGSAPGTR